MNEPGRLPPDIDGALHGAQQADPTDGAAVDRVRSRLMRRIAEDSVRHHTAVAGGADGWSPFLPGIARKVLHQQDGVMSYLLRFEPGARLPAHRHPLDEECVVIEGWLRIGELRLGPGAYHRVPRDVLDADSTSEDGCVIFLRGAVPRSEHLV